MNRRDFLKTGILGVVGYFGNSFISFADETINSFMNDVKISTYLGNSQRKYYGEGQISNLNVRKKYFLGSGKTIVGKETKVWSGAGWTGQPLLVNQNGIDYLVIGAFDHNLYKIRRDNFETQWKYQFDDVIKGTGTIIQTERGLEVIQGSRKGNNKNNSSNEVPSMRSISFETGEEIWRKDIERTASYSRDMDSSALDLMNGEVFAVGENAIGYFLDKNGKEVSRVRLFEEGDANKHRGNLVAESSPARFDDMIYISCGSGHVYGIDICEREIVWRHDIGSDLDGTISIDESGCLYCPIEKQYIAGNGGVIKLDPKKQNSVQWFLPTKNRKFASWDGGVIGSVSLNDLYCKETDNKLFASLAIDGNLYLGSQIEITGEKVKGPDGEIFYDTPKLYSVQSLAPSISTPIFSQGNKIIAPTYGGVFLLEYEFTDLKNENLEMKILSHALNGMSFEATPVVWDDCVYIACRDGYLYELND
ncbi:MAG TPA: hypothetical protein P5277_04080 [Candidatus Paceibacterota bacterium]|nr:hypothetical protein [Candidatus Paceibacterota bacterium]